MWHAGASLVSLYGRSFSSIFTINPPVIWMTTNVLPSSTPLRYRWIKGDPSVGRGCGVVRAEPQWNPREMPPRPGGALLPCLRRPFDPAGVTGSRRSPGKVSYGIYGWMYRCRWTTCTSRQTSSPPSPPLQGGGGVNLEGIFPFNENDAILWKIYTYYETPQLRINTATTCGGINTSTSKQPPSTKELLINQTVKFKTVTLPYGTFSMIPPFALCPNSPL